MSREIDERVVEMRFDNEQFEKNIQTSISSLDKLNKSLDLGGISSSLDDVGESTRNCATNISGLSSGVEEAGSKFSALEIIAITALVNITNSAVEAGKRMVASLSIDQIANGFTKYEEKTTAVQTIINATGKSIEEVNEQLEKLNWFTDETSYNFTDMVTNIGKFTSNGIELDTAVTAMMGIANWAALSGQNSEAAGRAMYNLSQAISVGAVKLQDWKSIENANMATQEFKEIAIETAKALGTLNENAETSGGTLVSASNFSSTLSEDWFTSDVLLAALEKYGNYTEEVYKVASEEGITAADAMKIVSSETMELGAKAFKAAQEAKTFTDAINATKDAVSSGWSATFETIFGNYEEAKVLWTDIANELYDIFAASAEGRNEMLAQWKELGGRDLMIEALMNTLSILKNVISTVSDAFHDIFPAVTAERLVEITKSFRDFTENLKNNESLFNNIQRVLKGFFALLNIGKNLISSIFKVLKPVTSAIPAVGGGILDLAGFLGDLIVKLNNFISDSNIFYVAFSKIGSIISRVIEYFKGLIGQLRETAVFNKIVTVLNNAVNAIKQFIGSAKENFDTDGFKAFHVVLEKLHTILSKIVSAISKVVSAFGSAISSMTSAIAGSTLIQVLTKLWDIVVAIAGCIARLLGEAISGLAEKLRDADFKGFFDLLSTISIGGIAVAITKFIKTIREPFDGLNDILSGVKGILDGVRGCFEAYQNKLKADTLMKIATAIAILAASLIILSVIDSEKLSDAISAIAMLFIGLMTSMAVLTKMSANIGKATKTTAMMLGMSTAVLLLATALKKLSGLDSDAMARGLLGVAGLTAIVVAAAKVLGSGKGTVLKGALQLMIFGAAINILASACVTLSKIPFGDMAKGLVGVGVLMAEVVAFLKLAKFNKQAISTSLGIVLLSTAIKVLSSACRVFAQMSWEEIGKGLAGVGALLIELAAFERIAGKGSKLISTGISLIAIAASMKIFASAMKSIASLSWEDIGKGLTAMGLSLLEVALALRLMPKDIFLKGAGLVVVSSSLLILASALRSMGGLQWDEIGKGLVTLGGSLAILAVALKAMRSTLSGAAALLVASAALAILAPVLALLGAMSWEAIGKGLLTLAGAFTVVGLAGLLIGPILPSVLGLAAALALVGVSVLAAGTGLAAAGVGLSTMAVGLTALAASVATGSGAIVAALGVIVQGVAGLIPTVATMLANGLIEFAMVIGEGAPIIAEAVESVVLNLIDVLITCVPAIVECIFVLLESVLTTLVEYAPTIVQAVFDILIACLEGIANNISMVVETAMEIVVGFIEGISRKLPDVVQAGFDLVINFINGLADAIDNNTKTLIDAVKHLITSILNAAVEILKGGVDLMIDVGKNLIQGLLEGIKNAAQSLWDGICDVGNSIKNWFCDLFGIHSPSTVFAEYGMNMDQGLANGLVKYLNVVEKATDEVGETTTDAMSRAISEATDIVNNDNFSEPTIRPVLDLSEIQNGAGRLSKMMSDVSDYNVNASMNLAGQTANGMSSGYVESEYDAINGIAKSLKKMAQPQANTITNTFNITGDNPQEIAEEVSRIIQKQIDRKGATWE